MNVRLYPLRQCYRSSTGKMAAILNCTLGYRWLVEIARNMIWLSSDRISQDEPLMGLPRRLSLPRPKTSWIVKTESNVRRERRRRPDPPCITCKGSGKINCSKCRGRGRMNLIHLSMLPKGEWPKCIKFFTSRCENCGGSGLIYCSRCQGMGKYREGLFEFLMTDAGTSNKEAMEKEQKIEERTVGDLWRNT